MLSHTYRYRALNESGASVDVTITERKWKFGADASVQWSNETTPMSAVTIADAASSATTAIDNSTDSYLGGELTVIATGSGTSGVVTIFLEISTDGGTDWPGSEGGIPIGAIDPSSTDTVNMTV